MTALILLSRPIFRPAGRVTLLMLLGLSLFHSVLRAQDTTQRLLRPAIFKTNVFGPFSGFLEVPVSARRSVQFSLQRSTFSLFTTTRFFSLTADYRFYTKLETATTLRPAPKGVYWGPYLKYRTVADERTGNSSGVTYSTITYTMLGGGLVAGKQFIYRSGLTVDLFLGLGYFPIISSQVTVSSSVYYRPEPKPADYQVDFRPGVCIGLAF